MKRVSNEFIEDISERVERLSKYSGLLSSELLRSISSNLALLKNERIQNDSSNTKTHHSEKNKQEDSSMKFCVNTLRSSFTEIKQLKKTDEDSQEIDALEQELEDLIGKLPSSSLVDFEISRIYPDLNNISSQIEILQHELLQAKEKLRKNLVFTRRIETEDIKDRVERLEKAIHAFKISSETKSVCVCNIF